MESLAAKAAKGGVLSLFISFYFPLVIKLETLGWALLFKVNLRANIEEGLRAEALALDGSLIDL